MIRRLFAHDAPEMASIHQALFPSSWPASDMKAHCKKDKVWGAGEPLAGFIIVRTALDQADILTLAVRPKKQRTGIGTQLLSQAEKSLCAAGVTTLYLEVAENNAPAIGLYKRSGYEMLARRPAYYRQKEGRVAALSFCKKLDARDTKG